MVLTDPPETLRERLARVRGVLLDLDGVLIVRGQPLPGAADGLAALSRAGIPFRIVTNTSLVSRATQADRLTATGIAVPPRWIVSAVSASAAYTRTRFPGRPLYVLAAPDARREFAGQWLLSHAEAAAPGVEVAAVVIGDSREELTYDNLNRAFRFVREGARFLAMHRNPWWLTEAGPTLDAGAFVAGLEYATRRRAVVLGKPSRPFFATAAAELSPLSHEQLAMIGDDVWNDVGGAQKAGLCGVLVLTGKHGAAELARAAAAGARAVHPDAIAASLEEVVAAIGG